MAEFFFAYPVVAQVQPHQVFKSVNELDIGNRIVREIEYFSDLPGFQCQPVF